MSCPARMTQHGGTANIHTFPPLVARPARTTPAVSAHPSTPHRPGLPYRTGQTSDKRRKTTGYRYPTHLDNKGAGSGALVNAGQVLAIERSM